MPAKITVRLQDGKVIEHEVQDYPGLASHPFTWEESVEKFDRLVAGRIDERLNREIKDAVRSVENIQVSGPDETARQRQGSCLGRVIEYDLTSSKRQATRKGRNRNSYSIRACSGNHRICRSQRMSAARGLGFQDWLRRVRNSRRRTRFPDSSATSASTRNARKPAPGIVGQTVRSRLLGTRARPPDKKEAAFRRLFSDLGAGPFGEASTTESGGMGQS